MNIPANDENLIGIQKKLGKKFLAHLLFEQITKVMAVYLPFTQEKLGCVDFRKRSAFGW